MKAEVKVNNADIAQEVECVLGKDEVTGSNPVISSKNKTTQRVVLFLVKLRWI